VVLLAATFLQGGGRSESFGKCSFSVGEKVEGLKFMDGLTVRWLDCLMVK